MRNNEQPLRTQCKAIMSSDSSPFGFVLLHRCMLKCPSDDIRSNVQPLIRTQRCHFHFFLSLWFHSQAPLHAYVTPEDVWTNVQTLIRTPGCHLLFSLSLSASSTFLSRPKPQRRKISLGKGKSSVLSCFHRDDRYFFQRYIL